MGKIVLNGDFGGFKLSMEQLKEYCRLKKYKYTIEKSFICDNLILENGKKLNCYSFKYNEDPEYNRKNETLIKIVENTPKEEGTTLYVKEFDDNFEWYIHEYDGAESLKLDENKTINKIKNMVEELKDNISHDDFLFKIIDKYFDFETPIINDKDFPRLQ